MRPRTLYLVILASALLSCAGHSPSPEPAVETAAKPETDAQANQNVTQRRHKRPPLPNGVVSLDVIYQNDKFHLLTGDHQDGLRTLWYQYSDDQGESWSKPVKVNQENQQPVLIRGNDPRIAVQGDNAVVVWTTHAPDRMHSSGPMEIALSQDRGKTWSAGKTPSDWPNGPHAFFAMASDGDNIRIVWLDSRDGKSSVRGSQGLRYAYTNDAGLNWSANATLDELTCACCWNSAKSGPDGELFVLYRDKQPSDMALGVIDGQHQWRRQSTVGAFDWKFEGCPHIGGGLDYQAGGQDTTVHSVVGTGHPKHLGVHYLRSEDNGSTWGSPVVLGNDTALHADVAVSLKGRVVAVWDMLDDNDELAIFSAESSDQGVNWSAPKRLSKPGMRASHPRILSRKQGFLALWTETTDGAVQTLAKRDL